MKNSKKPNRTKCEVYARIVGYFRPINQWNDAKREEFNDRKTFDIQKATGKEKIHPP